VVQRNRRAIPVWLVIAVVLFVFMLIVAAGVSFVTNWVVWLAAGLIAVCLHLWFNWNL
jgi:hypothetical protein